MKSETEFLEIIEYAPAACSVQNSPDRSSYVFLSKPENHECTDVLLQLILYATSINYYDNPYPARAAPPGALDKPASRPASRSRSDARVILYVRTLTVAASGATEPKALMFGSSESRNYE